MTALQWPDGILPIQQNYYLRTRSIVFDNPYTRQGQTSQRHTAYWVATLEFRLPLPKAAKLEALIAQLRGSTGTVLVPDFRKLIAQPILDSMSAYSARIGTLFFDDNYNFAEENEISGSLALEDAYPIYFGEKILLGEFIDALLVWTDDDVVLLTEDNAFIWADNVAEAFSLENGRTLAIEEEVTLDFGFEDCPTLLTEDDEELAVHYGGGWYEGDGDCTLAHGSDNELLIDGCAPWSPNILQFGDTLQTSTGRAHIITADAVTDINGRGKIKIMPKLRDDVIAQPLQIDGITICMRLVDDNAGMNETDIRSLSVYKLTFEEVI